MCGSIAWATLMPSQADCPLVLKWPVIGRQIPIEIGSKAHTWHATIRDSINIKRRILMLIASLQTISKSDKKRIVFLDRNFIMECSSQEL
jgi:hypothetical protein